MQTELVRASCQWAVVISSTFLQNGTLLPIYREHSPEFPTFNKNEKSKMVYDKENRVCFKVFIHKTVSVYNNLNPYQIPCCCSCCFMLTPQISSIKKKKKKSGIIQQIKGSWLLIFSVLLFLPGVNLTISVQVHSLSECTPWLRISDDASWN